MRRYIPNENGYSYYDCECKDPNKCLHIALIDWDRLSPLITTNTRMANPNVPVK